MSGCGKRGTCGPIVEASRDVESTRSSPDCTEHMEVFADHDESGSCEVKVRSGGASGGSKGGRSLFLAACTGFTARATKRITRESVSRNEVQSRRFVLLMGLEDELRFSYNRNFDLQEPDFRVSTTVEAPYPKRDNCSGTGWRPWRAARGPGTSGVKTEGKDVRV
jgi:hypothetical protein